MSYVCLQFGQCGNQLGSELFSLLDNDIRLSDNEISVDDNIEYSDKSKNKWFFKNKLEKLTARAILIDTENKVVKDIVKKRSKLANWKYDDDNCITENSGGAANNWALGYKIKGPNICELAIDLVRKQCENCDKLESILSFGSSAGGTGSGVGSYIIENLRDEFPNKSFMNVLVLPYSSGEVVTQNFNTLFTISKLYDSADAIIVIENDHLHKIASTQLKLPHIALSDLNSIISHQIASVFQPLKQMNNITDAILSISAHSSYKFLTVQTKSLIPESSRSFEAVLSWPVVKSNLINALKIPHSAQSKYPDDWTPKYVKSIGNIMFLRGADATNHPIGKNEPNFNMSELYVDWIPDRVRCMTLGENRKFLNNNRFATLVSNNSMIWPVLENSVSKSWNTFIHNAYVHQYTKYGIENEDFLEMFFKLEKIVKNYENL